LRFFEDSAWLRALVERLTDGHESVRAQPWKVGDAPTPYIKKMLSAIVGFEFTVARLTGKWKISQNHTVANRQGVVRGLNATGDPDSVEIADLIKSPLE